MCAGANWTAATRIEVPGTPIHLDHVELAKMFDQINPPELP
jgi:hypothetical protein